VLLTVEDTCTEENYRSLLERIFGLRLRTFGNFKNCSDIHMLWCGSISFSNFLKYFLYTSIYYWRNSCLRLKKKTAKKQPDVEIQIFPYISPCRLVNKLLTFIWLVVPSNSTSSSSRSVVFYSTRAVQHGRWRHCNVSNYLPVDNTPDDVCLQQHRCVILKSHVSTMWFILYTGKLKLTHETSKYMRCYHTGIYLCF